MSISEYVIGYPQDDLMHTTPKPNPPVTIVIPAYNEEDGIGQTLDELCKTDALHNFEILVVNDASTDHTPVVVSEFPRVRLINHTINRGYSGALITGMRRAKGDYVIWYDADGQHRCEDLVNVADTLLSEHLDYCIGVRSAESHEVQSRRLGKNVLRFIVRIAAGQPVQDFNSGLRGFRRDLILRYLHLLPEGFGASTMTTLIMIERHHLGSEVPIVVRERIGTSTVKPLRDGFRTMMIILRIVLLFKPLLFFSTIGLTLIVFGTIYGIIETITVGQGFPVFGALVIILGVQAFFFGLLNDQISLQRRERFEKYE